MQFEQALLNLLQDFYSALGGQRAIAAYVEPMLEWAADMLAEALGTSRMKVPKSMEAPFMRLVGECSSYPNGQKSATEQACHLHG